MPLIVLANWVVICYRSHRLRELSETPLILSWPYFHGLIPSWKNNSPQRTPSGAIGFFSGRAGGCPNISRQILGTMKKRTFFFVFGGELVRGIPNPNSCSFVIQVWNLGLERIRITSGSGFKNNGVVRICVRFERGFNKRGWPVDVYLILIEQIWNICSTVEL